MGEELNLPAARVHSEATFGSSTTAPGGSNATPGMAQPDREAQLEREIAALEAKKEELASLKRLKEEHTAHFKCVGCQAQGPETKLYYCSGYRSLVADKGKPKYH